MNTFIDSDVLNLLEAIKAICIEYIFVRPYNSGYSRINSLIVDFFICHTPKEF